MQKAPKIEQIAPPQPWKVENSRRDDSYRVFAIRTDRAVSPRTGETHDFYVLESTSWVNVIALTPEDEVVLVRQYRHGIRDVTLEIPGGMVEGDDTPLSAARKELREESGYEAESWVELGNVHPNPAIQSNRCYTYLALGARRVGDLQLDDKEDITVTLSPLGRLPDLIREGGITHGLVLAAFYRYFMEFVPSRQNQGKP